MYDPVSLCVLKPKSTQVQGYSAMLLPPAGTGCQTFQNASVFSATPKILFSTFYSPISFLIPIIKFLFLQSLLHPSQNSLPFSIIFAKPTEHVAVCMEFNCAIQLDTDINVCTCIRVCGCVSTCTKYIHRVCCEWVICTSHETDLLLQRLHFCGRNINLAEYMSETLTCKTMWSEFYNLFTFQSPSQTYNHNLKSLKMWHSLKQCSGDFH